MLEARANQAKDPGIRGRAIESGSVTFDGKLDEPFWPAVSGIKLRDTEETLWFQAYYPNYAKIAGTTVKFIWSGDALFIGIHCKESRTNRSQPENVEQGEILPSVQDQSVNVFIKTHQGSHYQIEVAPKDTFRVISDRTKNRNNDRTLGVEAATFTGENFWSAEIKIPVASGENEGHPTATSPWWVNVTRTRKVRGETVNFSLVGDGAGKHTNQYKKLFIEANRLGE